MSGQNGQMMDETRTGFPCRFSCRDAQTGRDTVFRPKAGTVEALVETRESRDKHEVEAHGELFAKAQPVWTPTKTFTINRQRRKV